MNPPTLKTSPPLLATAEKKELLTEFAEKTLKEGKVIPGTMAAEMCW